MAMRLVRDAVQETGRRFGRSASRSPTRKPSPHEPPSRPSPPLAGYAEIAGVSRQRARELGTLPGFPPAVVETQSGPLQMRSQVEAWVAKWERTKPGRPRKATPKALSPGHSGSFAALPRPDPLPTVRLRGNMTDPPPGIAQPCSDPVCNRAGHHYHWLEPGHALAACLFDICHGDPPNPADLAALPPSWRRLVKSVHRRCEGGADPGRRGAPHRPQRPE